MTALYILIGLALIVIPVTGLVLGRLLLGYADAHNAALRDLSKETFASLETAYKSQAREMSDMHTRLMEMVQVEHMSQTYIREMQDKSAQELRENPPEQMAMNSIEVSEWKAKNREAVERIAADAGTSIEDVVAAFANSK